MVQAKNVAQGFIVSASAICLFETFQLQSFYLTPWFGWLLFFVLAVPLTANFLMAAERFRAKKPMQEKVRQTKNVLMALQGFGLACWFFDVLSTVLVIDVKHASSELNPLGWPLSAFGALAYFLPITLISYYLLFRLKTKESFYGVLLITGVSIFMGLRNLGASLYNLPAIGNFAGYSDDWAVLGMWVAVVVALTAVNALMVNKNRRALVRA
jgi:hypothetical protein